MKPFISIQFLLCLVFLHFGNASAQNFVSSKPAVRVEHWQKRQADINTYIAQSKDLSAVKLLFVGDSITDFWLLDDNPWVSGQKYGRKIWDQSFATPGTDNFAFNMGISGDRLEHLLFRFLPKSEGGMGQLDSPVLNPEFIIVMMGINNSWAAEQPVVESIYQGVVANLKALHARKPAAHIVLQSLLPTNDTDKNKQLVLVVNQRLELLTRVGEFSKFTTYLNLYPSFTDSSGLQIAKFYTDGLHPNDEGYKVWRDRLLDHLSRARTSSSKGS
jgi:lysophospholipase L1-like esterase